MVHEKEDSYQKRLTDAEAPLIRRCLMTKQAADDYMLSPEIDKPKGQNPLNLPKKH